MRDVQRADWNRWVAGVALALAGGMVGCGPGGEDDSDTGTDAGMDAGSEFQAFHDDCTMTTGPADSAEETTKNLERAVARSEDGDVICMVDGDYQVKRELSITENNITLLGESQEGTVLDFAEQKEGANGILANVSENFAAINFTVKNTASDSIKAKGTDGVVFKNLTVTWEAGASEENGAYALYPVEASNVLIEGCEVSYARDAGVYLGQSETAIMRDNEAYGNVVGIEIENTFRAEAYNNNAHDNADGFLVINLPDLMVKGGGENLVYDNRIVNNNIENFGKEGTAVAKMPQGTGLLVVASNNNEIRDNTIKDNQSIGIGVVSYEIIEPSGAQDPDFDPFSEGNWVHDNVLGNNGYEAKDRAVIAKQMDGKVPQVFWDGNFDSEKDNSEKGLTNCFGGNKTPEDSAIGLELIDIQNKCPDNDMGDGASFCQNDCTKEKVESVELPERVTAMAKIGSSK